MSFMPYVAPEQMMKDRSEYAHKGIARGRSVIGLEYTDGAALHRGEHVGDAAQDQRDLRPVAFAGVGKYSEFEELRIAGIRLADLRGYQLRPGRREGARPGERVLAGAVDDLHPADEAVRGRAAVGEVNGRARRQRDLPRPVRRIRERRARVRRDGRHTPSSSPSASRAPIRQDMDAGRRPVGSGQALAAVAGQASSPPKRSRPASWIARGPSGASSGA